MAAPLPEPSIVDMLLDDSGPSQEADEHIDKKAKSASHSGKDVSNTEVEVSKTETKTAIDRSTGSSKSVEAVEVPVPDDPAGIMPPPGLDTDVVMVMHRMLAMQAEMQQQHMAAMNQLTTSVHALVQQQSHHAVEQQQQLLHQQQQLSAQQVVASAVAATPKHDASAPSGPSDARIEEAELVEIITHAPVVTDNKIDKDVLKHLQKVTNAFEKTIMKFHKTKKFVENVSADIEVMSSDSSRYPTGTRAFKSPEDASELDQNLDAAIDKDWTFSVVIKKGTARRGAMQQIHHAAALTFKHISLEAAKIHLTSLESQVTRAAFFKAAHDFKRDDVEGLGLQDGKTVLPNARLALEKAEELYTKVITKIREKRAKEAKQKEDAEQKKKDAEKKLLESKPENVLKEVIACVVDEKIAPLMKDKPKEEPEDDVHMIDDPIECVDDKAQRFVSAIKSKNEFSPGSTRGKRNKGAKGKGKGKGKGSKPSNGAKTWKAGELNRARIQSQSLSGSSPQQAQRPQNQWRRWQGGQRTMHSYFKPQKSRWNPNTHLAVWAQNRQNVWW